MPRAPWERDRGVASVIARWRADSALAASITMHHTHPARAGTPVEVPAVADGIRRALGQRGVRALWSHQAESFEHARAGDNVVVATPTASGKSLCYNLPTLHLLAERPDARALYLFPTRALARDQESALKELFAAASMPASVVTYDGDTGAQERRAARDRARVVISNPDMLHTGILPHHAAWQRFFASLAYVVVDELHAYSGVFGSHVAQVLRRLRRVARFHGANPVFLCASATVGNPGEHAARMIHGEVHAITESGAPSGPRHWMVMNPPLVNADLGIRQSYTRFTTRLAADLVRAGVPTMVFGQSRSTVETMLRYLRERLGPEGVREESIQAYRGGYLSGTRRRIEDGLRAGEIRCVVATSALELGIDVGDLDAVLCAGYPGTLAGTLQRFGRAGRRGAPSLGVLVTSSAPVDQYLARAPSYLTSAPIEEARIDPGNVEVLLQHMKCAAFELPFRRGEGYAEVPPEATTEALEYLAGEGLLHASGARWTWVADQYPAQSVSLRSVGWSNVLVIDVTRGTTLAEADRRTAHVSLHEGAIYQHEGATWVVERFDVEGSRAFVSPADVDYFTDATTAVDVRVLDATAFGTIGVLPEDVCGFGEVNVTTRVTGFKKIRFHTHEVIGHGELEGAEVEMQTASFWWTLPEDALSEPIEALEAQGLAGARARVLDGIRGIAHALATVTSLALMCDARDLRYTVGERDEDEALPERRGRAGASPTVFLYDTAPGGVGLAERAFERREELTPRALELIRGCPCDDGCPACVSPGIDGAQGRKAMALALLEVFGVV